MPTLPNTPQVIKFRLVGDAFGQAIDNVIHCNYTGGPPSSADIAAACFYVGNHWATRILPFVRSDYTLREVVGQDLTSPTAATGADNTNHAGGDTSGSSMSPSICWVVSWNIQRRYRGGKPRTYLSPVSDSHLATPVTWLGLQAANLDAAAGNFRADMSTLVVGTTSIASVGCVSYYTGRALRSAGLFEAFTGQSVDLRPGHQRRRDGKLNAVRD